MTSMEQQQEIMYSILVSYKKLIFQTTLTLILTTLFYFISIPTLLLHAINTYIHPDDVNPNNSKPQQNAPKFAIKRPSQIHNNNNNNNNPNSNSLNGFQSLNSRTSNELNNNNNKQHNKKRVFKDKFEFDESKAQIFRLNLAAPQIQSRLFYSYYSGFCNCLVLFCCCFVLHVFLCFNVSDNDELCGVGVVKDGSLVPIVVGVVGIFRVLVSGFRVSIERSAFKRSERQLGFGFGVLGFVVALVICLGVYPSVVDFEFRSFDGFGRLFVAVLCGFVAGFLYMGAGKNARAFWLGTNQIRCNLSIVSTGWFGQIVLYANHLVAGFSSLLWIKPFGEIFVSKGVAAHNGTQTRGLIDNVGMDEADFVKFRLCCLLLTGLLQVVALRVNVQTFLNEAVLSWYQRLHSSTVPDMDYSRAKVFLHNHYLCLAVVQFLSPSALILILLGLSQLDGGLFDNIQVMCGVLPCSVFVKETALFLAWWVAFVWFLFSSAYLAMYRRGILHVS